jgi:hypothetical protein
MSKSGWGASVSFFVGLGVQYAPIPEGWKLTITIAAGTGLAASIVGYVLTREPAAQATQNIEVLAPQQTGSVVTAGRDVHFHGNERSAQHRAEAIPEALYAAQLAEINRLQDFIGGKGESELWELFDFQKIARFNILRAKAVLAPKSVSPRELTEIDNCFTGGQATLSSRYSKVTRTEGGFQQEPIPGKLGILNHTAKHVSNKKLLERFGASHLLPIAIREAVKELHKAVVTNIHTLLDVINEVMTENPRKIIQEDNGESPLFGATYSAFLKKRVWLAPKQEAILKEIRAYLNLK